MHHHRSTVLSLLAVVTVTITAIAACSSRGPADTSGALQVAALASGAAAEPATGQEPAAAEPSTAEPTSADDASTGATPTADGGDGSDTDGTDPADGESDENETDAGTVDTAPDEAVGEVVDERPIVLPDPPIEPVWTDSGAATSRAQEFLLDLGFWLQDTSGEYGVSTSQAVLAFQKYYGLDTDGKLGPQTAEAMNAVAERPVGRSTGGTLVEVDKSKQLIFLIVDGRTEWVLNTSTGSEEPYREPDQNTPGAFIEDDSITRPGVFKVNRERSEGWWAGDLGEIYRPKYFDGGIALHGAYNVPPYPASHGCVRLSIPAMDWIWDNDVVPKGTTVWVHGEIPGDD